MIAINIIWLCLVLGKNQIYEEVLDAHRSKIKVEESGLSGNQDLQGTAIRINWFQLVFSHIPFHLEFKSLGDGLGLSSFRSCEPSLANQEEDTSTDGPIKIAFDGGRTNPQRKTKVPSSEDRMQDSDLKH